MNPLPLVLAEFRRNPFGCAAMVALIAIAVALGVALSAYERALRLAADAASVAGIADRLRLASFSFDGLIVTAVLLVIVAALSARRQSIGALRALGAPPMFVFVAVWLQGVLLIVLGDVLGLFLGFAWVVAMSAFSGSEPGLVVDVAFVVPELIVAGAVLVAGCLLAAAPSLPVLRVSAARLLRLG